MSFGGDANHGHREPAHTTSFSPTPSPSLSKEGSKYKLLHGLFRFSFFCLGMSHAVIELMEIVIDAHVGDGHLAAGITAEYQVAVELRNSVFCCCDNISQI